MKRTLTLLEMIIALFLTGILLSTLLGFFYRSLKQHAESQKLKQHTLQLLLFDHHFKHLLGQTKELFVAPYASSSQEALFIHFLSDVDPEWDFSSELDGTLYISKQKELCFSTLSPTQKRRNTVLLDKVEAFSMRCFDSKTKAWEMGWPTAKKESLPAMIEISIMQKGAATPFVFFLNPSTEPIPQGL